MNTGENPQGLRKIIDLTRMLSLLLLVLHGYYYCYAAFVSWGWQSVFTDRLLLQLEKTGLFHESWISKMLALAFLLLSQLGNQPAKSETARRGPALALAGLGFLLYGAAFIFLLLPGPPGPKALAYLSLTVTGYLLVLTGAGMLAKVLRPGWDSQDPFNRLNQTFPQQEKRLANDCSVHFRSRYRYQNQWRKSWINIINPFRGLLVVGSPGSGKSYFIIRQLIAQQLEKGFAMFVYDFKFDDLSRITYQALQQCRHHFRTPPNFYVINFDDLASSHRCNPLDPVSMLDITDAAESSRTIMMALNREWIRRQGDFFVESPINFLTAIIWYLRRYQDGRYCTLPHVIELMQVNYDELFSLLRMEPEIEALANPFITAYVNDVMEQLEGQVASAKIAITRLVSPALYYILSGNDFTLDINNASAPKIVCMGNNPQKQQVYGAVLSLYVTRLIRVVNRKGGIPCSLIFDEFPTLYFQGMDSLLATARSNKVATTLAVQDYSQLKKDYGRDQAEVIMNVVGNLICGQVMGETARQLSERFGRITQQRRSVSFHAAETSFGRSSQLDSAIPPSVLAGLSSGEFAGMLADNADQKVELKLFHGEILPDPQPPKECPTPWDSKAAGNEKEVAANFERIRQDIRQLVEREIGAALQDPARKHLLVRKDSRET